MKKILFKSDLFIQYLETKSENFSNDFNNLLQILKGDSEYEGYITTIERKKFLSSLTEIYDGNRADAESIVDSFISELNISYIENGLLFDYVLTENITTDDQISNNISIKQFLIRYGLEEIYNKRDEEGISEPILNLETDLSSKFNNIGLGEGNVLFTKFNDIELEEETVLFPKFNDIELEEETVLFPKFNDIELEEETDLFPKFNDIELEEETVLFAGADDIGLGEGNVLFTKFNDIGLGEGSGGNHDDDDLFGSNQ